MVVVIMKIMTALITGDIGSRFPESSQMSTSEAHKAMERLLLFSWLKVHFAPATQSGKE